MKHDTLGDDPNRWADEMFYTRRTIEPETNAEQRAYQAWPEQNSARIEARNDRIDGAEGVIPVPLWVHPFHDGPGGPQPIAMQRVLKNLDHTLRDEVVVPPCDGDGVSAAGG